MKQIKDNDIKKCTAASHSVRHDYKELFSYKKVETSSSPSLSTIITWILNFSRVMKGGS